MVLYRNPTYANIESTKLNRLYWVLRILVTSYLFYIIYTSGTYLETIKGHAVEDIRFNGYLTLDVFNSIFDSYDIMHDTVITNSVYIPINTTMKLNQQKEKVEGIISKKRAPKYCLSEKFCSSGCKNKPFQMFELLTEGKCSDSNKNYCETQSWCDPIIETSPVYKFKGISDSSIDVNIRVLFDKPESKVISFVRNIKVTDLLDRIEGVGVKYDKETDTFEPAVLIAFFDIKCAPFMDCKETLKVIRLDTGTTETGPSKVFKKFQFKFNKKENIDDDSDRRNFDEYRDLYHMHGLRITFDVRAHKSLFNVVRFLMTIGSAVTYTGIVDLFMDLCIWLLLGGFAYENIKYAGRQEDDKKMKLMFERITKEVVEGKHK